MNKRFYFQEVGFNNNNIIVIEKGANEGIRFDLDGRRNKTYVTLSEWIDFSKKRPNTTLRLTRKQAEALKYKGFRKFLRGK